MRTTQIARAPREQRVVEEASIVVTTGSRRGG
jgi:hypothetical protein